MRKLAFVLLVLAAAALVSAQQEPDLSNTLGGSTTLSGGSSLSGGMSGTTNFPAGLGGGPNLPVGRIGDNDLLGIAVYDAPPLTGSVRVSQEGDILLPMVPQPIHAAGLYPRDLEKRIAAVLIKDHLLVNPIVTVTIMEYDSRPISVVGAVKSPVTFQAMGSVTLLDAISRAGGFADDAGPEILISGEAPGPDGKDTTLIQRVPARSLLDSVNPALNIELHGGEVVRVPQAGRVLVVGDVGKPGYYYITGTESSIMKAVALSGGLGQRPGKVAYIYRREGGSRKRNEIPVPLKKIMARKSPDVALEANDMLYIPQNGHGLSPAVLNAILAGSIGIGTSLIYIYH